MCSIKNYCKVLTTSKCFEFFIVLVILANSVLIGVETYTDYPPVKSVQHWILGVFTIEIAMRFIASGSMKSFFTDGWNLFDLVLVVIGYIPESLVTNMSMMLAFRVLRVFRVLRLLRTAKEIKVIITVLIRSFSAMFYNVILFLIFIYLYAIVGVGLFKLPNPDKLMGDDKIRYEQFTQKALNSPLNSPDPFGTLDEAMFTLFRELTGEDWTDLRYNHITASELGVLPVNSTVVNVYHISWIVLAAFLLLNLVTGAIINNYQTVMSESEKRQV